MRVCFKQAAWRNVAYQQWRISGIKQQQAAAAYAGIEAAWRSMAWLAAKTA